MLCCVVLYCVVLCCVVLCVGEGRVGKACVSSCICCVSGGLVV